jgi:hypothetical protein
MAGIVIMMRKKRSPPKNLEEMRIDEIRLYETKPEPSAPPEIPDN